MAQFYSPPEGIKGDKIILPLGESEHLRRVVRKGKGDRIRVFDGIGGLYEAEITAFVPRAECRILRKSKPGIKREKILALGITARNSFESALDFAVEAGADIILPVLCERSQRGFAEKFGARRERFEKIILSAAKQSERDFLPLLENPVPFTDIFSVKIPVYLADFNGGKKIRVSGKKALVAVGPEGGFSEKEREYAARKGAEFIRISDNILRSELAAGVALSLLSYEEKGLF